MGKDYRALRELEKELLRSLEAQRELNETGWSQPESRLERVYRRFVEELKKLAEEEDLNSKPDDPVAPRDLTHEP